MNIQIPQKKNGFTLIELLVVMTIIAIIATLGITAYLNAMRNTRNAKNISNLNAIQSSFEQYYSVTGSYNDNCSLMAAGIQSGSLPTNAPNSPTYYEDCTATSYCMCADLEGNAEDATPDPVKGGNSTAACAAFDTDGIASHFCIKNQQ